MSYPITLTGKSLVGRLHGDVRRTRRSLSFWDDLQDDFLLMLLVRTRGSPARNDVVLIYVLVWDGFRIFCVSATKLEDLW